MPGNLNERIMHPNAQRVQELLRALGSDAQVHEMADSTRTSAEAAAAIGCEVAQIAKTVVFRADDTTVVVLASGADRVDTKKLKAVTGARKVDRADADAVRAATGYSIGGVSPIGLPAGVTLLLDKQLANFDVVWAAGGTPFAVFPTTFDELLAMTSGQPADCRQDG